MSQAAFLQADGTNYQQQPAAYSMVAGAPPMTTMAIRPLLPPNLWPHSFLILSVVVAGILGFLNILTLSLTIPAAILAFIVCSSSLDTRAR